MHNNYYCIRQISARLDRHLNGWELISCFSQNKNELVIVFAQSASEFILRASLNPEFSCISFPETFHRTKRNSVDLFPEVVGSQVLRVHQYVNERAFILYFDNGYSLLFKLYGARSNILLYRENEVLSLFRTKLVKDKGLNLLELDRPIEQSYDAFARAGYDYKPIFPTFNVVVQNFLEMHGYFELDNKEKWGFLERLKTQLENPTAYYITEEGDKPGFSLLKFGNIVREFSDPLEAITQFFISFTREYYFSKEKKEILDKLEQLLGKTWNYLLKSKAKLEDVETKSRHEDMANIIMANIYNIPPKAEEVQLYDFYTDQTISVKLKKDLSPQKNAEIYYRKAKNQKFEIKNIRENIYLRQKELRTLEKHIASIKAIGDLKSLRSYIKENHLQRSKAVNEETYPFRQFVFQDYEIWVGKSAKSNDELTQKYTKKDDIWLHAKDVTGSHVVIKYKSKQPVPRPVIEKAAQLAAYYSKRKTDTLCPVLYTPKKYVRKPKGAHPGQVVVEREDVILVTPDNSV
jgi:predicted ribosome quality control (RQC) complex YloA/Tae2 family protein